MLRFDCTSFPCRAVRANTWWQFTYRPDPERPDLAETVGVSIADDGTVTGANDAAGEPVVATLPVHGEVVDDEDGVTRLTLVDAAGTAICATAREFPHT